MIIRVIISVMAIVFTAIYAVSYQVVEQTKKPEIKIVESKEDRNVIQLYQTLKMHVTDQEVMCLHAIYFLKQVLKIVWASTQLDRSQSTD